MSYYPLVNNSQQLSKLDAWMFHTFKQALILRNKLWIKKYGISLPCPIPNWIDNIDKVGKIKINNMIYDLSIPRFSLINKAMKASITRRGLTSVVNPKSIYYSK